ncbi:signal peptidase II [Kineothrix sedimenti]|uniref:Lipoprotein signal peptidase n=1 Tax=Kineothrix sedimenti TaxID=3123317 RepID=A0ABZ3EUN9_9FIRM
MNYIGITAAIFGADFFIKNHMEKTLEEGKEVEKAKGFVRLRKHHNKGAFLNAGQEKRPVVAFVSLALTLILTVFFIMTLGTKGNTALKMGLSLLLGGAFSNTYDRLKRGYVVDYLSFHVRWKWFSNIIFNISDFCIIIGAFVTALSMGNDKNT